MVLVFLSIMNYLIDSYTIFAASVLAANSVLRSLFGAAFPLFTTQMFTNLGIHWAASIPAFLALMCVPFPFLFYKYGPAIRQRCKFAAESDAFMRKMREENQDGDQESEEEKEQEAMDEAELSDPEEKEAPRFEPITREPTNSRNVMTRTATQNTNRSTRSIRSEYDGNPYDIDRVNTQTSFSQANQPKSVKSGKSGRFFKS
jgi:hypothetical protein